MHTVTFDVETIPCQLPGAMDEFRAAVQAPGQFKKPESIQAWLDENREAEAKAAWLKTSFDGGMGHAVVIALAMDDGPTVAYSVPADGYGKRDAEVQMLQDFFSHLTDIGRCVLVGYNVIGFDLPFLWKRCIVLGVKPPSWFPRNPSKYSSEMVKDTMLLWDQEQRAGGSMDRLCRILGIPGKEGMSGADVWPAVEAGRMAEVAAYCCDDVERTRSMFRRMTFTDRLSMIAAAREFQDA